MRVQQGIWDVSRHRPDSPGRSGRKWKSRNLITRASARGELAEETGLTAALADAEAMIPGGLLLPTALSWPWLAASKKPHVNDVLPVVTSATALTQADQAAIHDYSGFPEPFPGGASPKLSSEPSLSKNLNSKPLL